MAARKTRWSPQSVREKIQAGLLTKRLQDFALCTDEDPKKQMTSGQLKAAEILLRKAVPDLSSVTHEDADGKNPFKALEVRIVKPNAPSSE